MNLKKILLSSVAAVTLTSVSAFAAGANDGSNAVVAAQDGTGDYLVIPAYFANSAGWSTNIKVVNTNTTHAVVAKVVFRESAQSEEYLDFPIYLTPGDVWEGAVSYSNGNVILTSSDDSMYSSGSGTSIQMADTAPITKAFPSLKAPRQNPFMGYVEVFGLASVNAGDVVDTNDLLDGTWTPGNKLAKTLLYSKFIAQLNGAGGTTTEWSHVDNNSIYAQAVISAANANGNLAMTLPAAAFENVTGTGPQLNQVTSVDTTLVNSSNWTTKSALVTSIENAIAKSNVFVTYYENAANTALADTVLLVNQPMKKYRYDLTDDLDAVGYDTVSLNAAARTGTNDYTNVVVTTAVDAPDKWSFTYVGIQRDQEEHTPTVTYDQFSGFPTTTTTTMCNTELCYLDLGASDMTDYVKGYVDVFLQPGATRALPVIPAVMSAKSVGGTNVTNIIYPAYKAVIN